LQTDAITRFHARYFAHELTKRCPTDSVQKLAAILADARVEGIILDPVYAERQFGALVDLIPKRTFSGTRNNPMRSALMPALRAG